MQVVTNDTIWNKSVPLKLSLFCSVDTTYLDSYKNILVQGGVIQQNSNVCVGGRGSMDKCSYGESLTFERQSLNIIGLYYK